MQITELRKLNEMEMLLRRKIRIVLVEDHEMFREGLQLLLSSISSIETTGSFSNGDELKKFLKTETEPDVILMDIKLKDESGIDLTSYLKREYTKIRVIALSMFDNPNIILKMISSGACGYLMKNVSKEELKTAITNVIQGEEYYCKEAAHQVMQHMAKKEKQTMSGDLNLRGFTLREIQIIRMICDGKSNKEIAESLYISSRTVESHRMRIMRKMEVSSSAELVKFAIRNDMYQV
ncbi:MAG: response regulator transcription factor [Candidatus Competibacteraceae bacterium]|nr:response regulator transcription factor [Candidatus Competibacteraceae bacterium]